MLKEIISQITTSNLLEKGIRNKQMPGLTYQFFAKEYQVDVNCINDHNLMFYFSQTDDV